MNDTQAAIDEIRALMQKIRSSSTSLDVLSHLMDQQKILIMRLESRDPAELSQIKECLYEIKDEYAELITEFKARAADIKTSLLNVNFLKQYLIK